MPVWSSAALRPIAEVSRLEEIAADLERRVESCSPRRGVDARSARAAAAGDRRRPAADGQDVAKLDG
jgi:hypothetical protein